MRRCNHSGCDKIATPPLIICAEHQEQYNSAAYLRRSAPPADEWRTKLAEELGEGEETS